MYYIRQMGATPPAALSTPPTIGLIAGIPLGWLRKPVSYAVDVAEGDSQPQHLGNVVSGVLTGKDGTAPH